MLISENDQDELAKRGFDQEYTPVRLTKEFLENIVQMAEAKCGESEIDNLVIGAPEVWFQEMNTVSGRGTLRDICQQLPNVRPEGVKVVSEPSCAGAFFAYNYMVLKGKPFSGHILLVDYGGGTLDINLHQYQCRTRSRMADRRCRSKSWKVQEPGRIQKVRSGRQVCVTWKVWQSVPIYQKRTMGSG